MVLLAGRKPDFLMEEQRKYFIDVVPSDSGRRSRPHQMLPC